MAPFVESIYSHSDPDRAPNLFSKTTDFHFHDEQGRLTHRSLPLRNRDFRVVAVESTGHGAAFSEEERTALTIPLQGRSEVEIAGQVVSTSVGEVFVISPSTRKSCLRPDRAGQYRSYTVIGPALGGDLSIQPERWLQSRDASLRNQAISMLNLAFSMTLGEPRHSETAINALEALIVELFWLVLSPGLGDVPVVRNGADARRLVSRAKDYLDTEYHEAISLPDVSAFLGVSPRTLQKAFQRHCGMTPRAYLNRVRLEQMHRILQHPAEHTTVTSAAMSVGLFHVGRCSQAYKVHFGELPSATLARRRGEAGT